MSKQTTTTMCEIAGAGEIKNDSAVCKSFCVQHVGMDLILVRSAVLHVHLS